MKNSKKEIAKFFSGLTAWEAIVHASFALSGILPITIFGITISPAVNTIQVFLPAFFSILLAWYGWIKK